MGLVPCGICGTVEALAQSFRSLNDIIWYEDYLKIAAIQYQEMIENANKFWYSSKQFIM